MKEFYENLKKKRQANNISLEAVHQKTRLPMQYLQAIENGRMQELPKAYELMYLRRYAREIGLEPDEVVRDYELLSGKLTPAESNEAKQQAEGKQSASAATQPISTTVKETLDEVNLDRVNNYFWPVLIVLIFAVGSFLVYRFYAAENANQTPEIKEISIGELMERVATDSSANPAAQFEDSLTTLPGEATGVNSDIRNVAGNPQSSSQTSENNSASAVNLQIRSLDRVWVQEIRDQADTTDYILEGGLSRSINAKSQIELVIGRADALELLLNGNNLGVIGDSSQVARLTLTPQGISQKRLTRVPDSGE